MDKFLLILLYTFSFFAGEFDAQSISNFFEQISTKNGLSQNSVYSIAQDDLGFIWIGTEDGLNKYDGERFVCFYNDPDNPNSLSSSYILSIVKGDRNILWIGTISGLNKYNLKTEQFKRYNFNNGNVSDATDNEIRSLYYDEKGILWIGTFGSGLIKFNTINEKYKVYRHISNDKNSIADNRIRKIIPDIDNGKLFLWIATADGLNLLNTNEEQFQNIQSLSNVNKSFNDKSIFSIFLTDDDEGKYLWFSNQSGLFQKLSLSDNNYDKLIPQIVTCSYRSNSFEDNSQQPVLQMFQTEKGKESFELLLGTSTNGLIIYNYRFRSWYNIRNSIYNSKSLSDNSITSIFEDINGILWLGTDAGGVSKYNVLSSYFQTYAKDIEGTLSLNENFVWSICEDANGILWVGTDSGGLNKIDRAKGTVKYYKNIKNDDYSISDNIVTCLFEDPDAPGKILWVGTWNGGLNKFDIDNEKFISYKHDANDSTSISWNFVKDILKDTLADGSQVLWVGCALGGLNRFDIMNGTFKHYKHNPTDPESISHNFIYTITKDHEKNIWVGSRGGLSKLNKLSGKFTNYKHSTDSLSLSHNSVLSIHEDSIGNFWLGTFGGGLNHFDKSAGTFLHYTTENGLENNVVYGILEDKNHNLWISTNDGITKFITQKDEMDFYSKYLLTKEQQSGLFINFTFDEELRYNESNAGAYFKSKTGMMYFGGLNGVVAFDPSDIKINTNPPEIYFTNFSKYAKNIRVDSLITFTETVYLDYDDHLITFEFSALEFSTPEKNQYAYRVAGLSEEWIKLGKESRITFPKLEPGDYILSVTASNSSNIWNTSGKSVTIIVKPPFWLTWWFRISFVLLTLFIILFIIRLRVIKIRKHNKELLSINEILNNEINERKKIETALTSSEERFRELAELLPEVIFETDIVGNLTYVNNAAFEKFKYSRTDFENGINFTQVLDPSEFESAKGNFQRVLNGEILGFKEYLALKNKGNF